MHLDKKTIIGTSGILVFALVLGISSVTVDNTVNKDSYGIHSSAGANAAIGNNSNTVAGANGAVDESLGVVDTDGYVVGQGVENETYGYTNLGLANVEEGNLNVRKEASTDAGVAGKMTRYAACEILGEENGFYKITSGKLEGYVSKDYIITGEEALAIAKEEAKLMATVNTEALRVREEASTESDTLAIVNQDDDFVVVEELDGWIKIEVDDYQGYISSEFAVVGMKLQTGNTLKELAYGEGISDIRI